MLLVDFFRASVLNSSSSAFYLAVSDSKYISFADKLIKVKNTHCRLINPHNARERLAKENKIEKYEALLYMLDNVYKIPPSIRYANFNGTNDF